MFDDQQSDQAQDTDNQTDNNGLGAAPATGLGMNPSAGLVTPVADSTEPVVVVPDEPAQTVPAASDDAPAHGSTSSDNGDLADIKRQALEQLSPLVHKLEQTPEEKYKTLIMMIQASDNQELLGEAYEAAQAISDEKAKAEALLNIVNEINYFTQKS
jgi:hypothetical protein